MRPRSSAQIASALLLTLLAACGPPKPAGEFPMPTVDLCRPQNLEVTVNDGRMDLTWENECDRLISGYYVYISDQPLVPSYPDTVLPPEIKPFNQAAFPGDTDPDDGIEHFTADRLKNHHRYWVSVRTVYPDRTLSRPSNEVLAVCGPRGQIELGVRYRSDHDGFSFLTLDYVQADNIANDFYFFSKDGHNYLASPSRLDGFLRATRLRRLPFRGTFEEIKDRLPELESRAFEDRVEVSEGDWVWLDLPEGENALLQVLKISGEGDDLSIELFYAYTALDDSLVF